MVRPSFFIIGAPRCGTTSLAAWLSADPRLFLSQPKEPHHFGADLDMRVRPFASEARYLELFARARAGQIAGEASVLTLYSASAPAEILRFAPEARVIVLLRDPSEMVPSLHGHNRLLGYEDLPRLSDAIAAEPERREGRRLPWSCLLPASLQYTRLGRYAEHVERWQEALGRDRVLCFLFEDVRDEPERVFRECLAFLGLEAKDLPDFKAHNERKRWRSNRLGRLVMGSFGRGYDLAMRVPSRLLRLPLLIPLALLLRVSALAIEKDDAARLPAAERDALRRLFRDDVERLSKVLGRDLSAWTAA